MRFFFRSRQFKILLIGVAVIAALSIIAAIIGGVLTPQSSLLASISAPFEKIATDVSAFFDEAGKRLQSNEKAILKNVCTILKRNLNVFGIIRYIGLFYPFFWHSSRGSLRYTVLEPQDTAAPGVLNNDGGAAQCSTSGSLLLPEGLTVGALVHSGVHLMGTHQDPLQGTVVGIVTVIGTLGDGAFDTLVGMAAHCVPPPFCFFGSSMPCHRENIRGNPSSH
jgi:hypothetical protein